MNIKRSNKGSSICYACSAHLPIVIKSPNIQIQLCEDCKLEDKTLISKSNAVKEFLLEDIDLKNIPCNTVRNKYEKDTKFYYYYDVFDQAVKKYGSIKEFTDIKFNKKRPKVIELDVLKIDNTNFPLQRKLDFIKSLPNICCTFLMSCPEYNNFVKKGTKSGFTYDQVCELIKNYYFLVKNTNYPALMNINNTFKYDEKVKDVALSYYIKTGGNPNKIPYSLLENSYDILKNYDSVILNYEKEKRKKLLY